jgi:hypothetical protein
MRDGIDLLTIDPADLGAVRALVSRLRPILTADQCRQLLTDPDRWNRHHAAPDPPAQAATARHSRPASWWEWWQRWWNDRRRRQWGGQLA